MKGERERGEGREEGEGGGRREAKGTPWARERARRFWKAMLDTKGLPLLVVTTWLSGDVMAPVANGNIEGAVLLLTEAGALVLIMFPMGVVLVSSPMFVLIAASLSTFVATCALACRAMPVLLFLATLVLGALALPFFASIVVVVVVLIALISLPSAAILATFPTTLVLQFGSMFVPISTCTFVLVSRLFVLVFSASLVLLFPDILT